MLMSIYLLILTSFLIFLHFYQISHHNVWTRCVFQTMVLICPLSTNQQPWPPLKSVPSLLVNKSWTIWIFVLRTSGNPCGFWRSSLFPSKPLERLYLNIQQFVT
eukprot:Lithocolla_globosa_v1_NODE_1615_length_2446_cov_108.467169.p3 type:complete len:104 gc:universal NODE_1615_length_2446_cov_108.467169:352-41(-)